MPSFDQDLPSLAVRFTPIIGPAKDQLAGSRRHRRKRDERVRGSRREQFGAEHLFAVISTDETVDDVARDCGVLVVESVAGFQRMLDQSLELGDFAMLCAWQYFG